MQDEQLSRLHDLSEVIKHLSQISLKQAAVVRTLEEKMTALNSKVDALQAGLNELKGI